MALGRPVLRALPAGTSQPALDGCLGQLLAGLYVLRLTTPAGTQVLKAVRNSAAGTL